MVGDLVRALAISSISLSTSSMPSLLEEPTEEVSSSLEEDIKNGVLKAGVSARETSKIVRSAVAIGEEDPYDTSSSRADTTLVIAAYFSIGSAISGLVVFSLSLLPPPRGDDPTIVYTLLDIDGRSSTERKNPHSSFPRLY